LDEAFELQEPFEKDCINLLLGIMVSSNQELFDSIKNGGTGIMNEVLREFFKEEIKAGEEQARNEGVREGHKEGRLEGCKEGRLEGREEGRIETLYTDCNMSVPDIAKKVSKSEEYVREIIKKISAACL
jgi:probable transposase